MLNENRPTGSEIAHDILNEVVLLVLNPWVTEISEEPETHKEIKQVKLSSTRLASVAKVVGDKTITLRYSR